jgi:hypothetical protein
MLFTLDYDLQNKTWNSENGRMSDKYTSKMTVIGSTGR